MIRHLLHKPIWQRNFRFCLYCWCKTHWKKLKHLVQIDCKTKLHIPQEILQQSHISIAFRIALSFTRKTVKREKELLEENVTSLSGKWHNSIRKSCLWPFFKALGAKRERRPRFFSFYTCIVGKYSSFVNEYSLLHLFFVFFFHLKNVFLQGDDIQLI